MTHFYERAYNVWFGCCIVGEVPSRMAALVIPRRSSALALHQWWQRRNAHHWNVVSSVFRSNCNHQSISFLARAYSSAYYDLLPRLWHKSLRTGHCSGGRLGIRRSLSHVHYISFHRSTPYRPQKLHTPNSDLHSSIMQELSSAIPFLSMPDNIHFH